MSEEKNDLLYEFSDGPYEVLNYTIKEDEGKVLIEVNDGDLGRLVVESKDAIDHLREALSEAELYFTENDRRKEEL